MPHMTFATRAPSARSKPVQLLIVDDSAMFRRMLAMGLAHSPLIEIIGSVGSAREARRVIAERRPDVIALDMEMPRENGLSFLKDYMPRDPIPTVVISSHTAKAMDITIAALEAGAVDVIDKPVLGLPDAGSRATVMADIVARIISAASAKFGGMNDAAKRIHLAERLAHSRKNAPDKQMPPADIEFAPNWMIAIGASTGGVQALSAVLPQFPRHSPPIVIVQHMPAGFTAAFARRLDSICQIEVREARDGDQPRPGLALIAPGGERHLVAVRDQCGLTLKLIEGAPVCYSRPSVDVMFSSLAQHHGARLSAAILTGMGRDGAQGLLDIRKLGGRCFAQDESSSEIYGMPARAVENGAAEAQVALGQMADVLMNSAKAQTPQKFWQE